jgi:hypothetical protein
MTKALVALVVVLLASCTASAEIKRVDTLTATGPCYVPATLQAYLTRDGFAARASGHSENSSGKSSVVLFYVKDQDFVIVLRSRNLACVLVVGRELSDL